VADVDSKRDAYRVEVIDLGLMQLACSSPIQAPSGTYAYQPPEQFVPDDGDRSKTARLDHPEKADVFALGGIAYWLVTKRDPFVDSPRKSDRSPMRPVIPKDRAPWSVAGRYVISQCFANDPNDRPELDALLDVSSDYDEEVL
jgi:serine/threonine protein kinase